MVKPFRCFSVLLLLIIPWGPRSAHADGGRFDLAGPKIDVRVTRNGVSLPISAVPNLQPGDQIWLHPDLPPTQSVRYLLIAAFLRGTTNPPPENWFTRIETWNKKVRQEGVTITVPDEAQQAVLFLAPETGGDYSTLRSAVTGRPGIFVRATQDLNEAGFEQARIEKYLAEMAKVPPTDPAALQEHSNLLARTLNLKPNPDCFKKPLDQQYNCLTQSGTQLLLDDGHGQTIASALSSGPTSDFINQASYTQMAGGGMYSAYVGAIVDLVRLTSGLHTAQYQYIPAIAFPTDASLNLRLNTPPSFHNPKSVLVIGLPAIQKSVLPPLRQAEPDHISCLLEPNAAIPIDGAPLVFSTSLAHDLVLHLNALVPGANGKPGPRNIPVVPDAFQGGLKVAIDPSPRKELPPDNPDNASTTKLAPPPPLLKPGQLLTGTIEGMWGFDHFTGPTVPLQDTPGIGWRIVSKADAPADLIAGQPNHLELVSTGTACIQSITLEPGGTKVEWKLAGTGKDDKTGNDAGKAQGKADQAQAAAVAPPKPDRPVDLTLNLQRTGTPGAVELAIRQYGQPATEQLSAKTFSELPKVTSIVLHEGDRSLTLNGSGLYQVKQLTLDVPDKPAFTPNPDGTDRTQTLSLPRNSKGQDAKVPGLKAGDPFTATVLLADGRTVEARSTVQIQRPKVSLLSKRITPLPPAAAAEAGVAAGPSPIKLASSDDLPLGSQLLFFLKSEQKFPRDEKIEIASADDALHTTLSIAAGTLVLQDSHTVLGRLDPLKTFGAVAADGTEGEWIPLATLVRLPTLSGVHCPTDLTRSCLLDGSDLYLIDSIANDPSFNPATDVPEGFVDNTLAIPHPTLNGFFLRLRDDPTAVHAVIMPVTMDTPAAGTTVAKHSVKANPAGIPVASPVPAAAPPPTTAPAATPASNPPPR
jgi:hypothetical protein